MDITPCVGIGDGAFTPAHPTEPGAENLKHLFGDAIKALDRHIADLQQRGVGVLSVRRLAAVLL